MSVNSRPAWIRSASFDVPFILLPPFLSVAVILLLHAMGSLPVDLPAWSWLALIVGIDVAHVYATLFVTYWNRAARQEHQQLFIAAPVIGFTLAVFFYSWGAPVFWRVLAYLAVFHFVRQQYGFVRLYSKQEAGVWPRRIDMLAIYASTLYPLLYWHATLPKSFVWFYPGDFVALPLRSALPFLQLLWGGLLALYLAKEWRVSRISGQFPWPRMAVIGGTALSWYTGIVLFDADSVFTLSNVVAHGVPYVALVWATHEPRIARAPVVAVLVFASTLLIIAYLEEALWDALVWRQHETFFTAFYVLPSVGDSMLAILIPLLALPQITHYLLDGFIWRLRKKPRLAGMT